MSPATTSAALFGTKFCCQNADISARDIAFTDASVPISLYPYGCRSPYSTIAVTCPATCDGLSRCCTSLAEPLRPLAFDFFRRKRRMQRDVGDQIEQRAEVLAQ